MTTISFPTDVTNHSSPEQDQELQPIPLRALCVGVFRKFKEAILAISEYAKQENEPGTVAVFKRLATAENNCLQHLKDDDFRNKMNTVGKMSRCIAKLIPPQNSTPEDGKKPPLEHKNLDEALRTLRQYSSSNTIPMWLESILRPLCPPNTL